MKRNILIPMFCLLGTLSLQAQIAPAHTDVAYNSGNNTVTALHYGRGNTLESITVTGKTQTTIQLSPNGQPKSISNEYATIEYTFAGTSNVTAHQTVNGKTKTEKVPMNSESVLYFRKQWANLKNKAVEYAGKADKFLEGGGIELVGGIVKAINGGLAGSIGVCFDQALEAGKKTDNPIISINTLENLQKASNIHLSLKDAAGDAATEWFFKNYRELRDGWSDMVYNDMMTKDRHQRENNRKEQSWRMELATLLLEAGHTPEEVGDILRKGGGKPDNESKPDDRTKPGNDTKPGDETKPGNDTKPGDNADKKKDDEKRRDYGNLVNPQTPQDIIDYVNLRKGREGGKLPLRVNVFYEPYLLSSGLCYDLVLNKDKKTYSVKLVNEALKIDYDKELDEPTCRIVLWYARPFDKGTDEIVIKMKKGQVPSKL